MVQRTAARRFLISVLLLAGHPACTPTSRPLRSQNVGPQATAIRNVQVAAAPAASPQLTREERALCEASTLSQSTLLTFMQHGKNLRRLTGRYDGDEELPAPGLTMDVDPQRTPSVVHALQKQVGPGNVVFVSERGFAFNKPDSVSVLKATDAFDALRVMGTNGANYGISVDDIVARLKKWDGAFGLKLYGIGYDWLEAEFVHQPPDIAAFAKEVYAFCPDVVDQGTSTVAALEREMARSNSVALWWD